MIQETRLQSLLTGVVSSESRVSANAVTQDPGSFLELLRNNINDSDLSGTESIQTPVDECRDVPGFEPEPQNEYIVQATQPRDGETLEDDAPRNDIGDDNETTQPVMQDNHPAEETRCAEPKAEGGETQQRGREPAADDARNTKAEPASQIVHIPVMTISPQRETSPAKEQDQQQNTQQPVRGSQDLAARLRDLSVVLNRLAPEASNIEMNTMAEKRPNRQRHETDTRELPTKNDIITAREIIDRILADREAGDPAGKTTVQLQTLLQRFSGHGEEEKGIQQTVQNAAEFRDLNVRLAAVIESLQGDAGAGKNNDTGGNQQNGLHFGMGKNDGAQRTQHIQDTAQAQPKFFQEQLQQMVDQAKITVRDAGNAAISLRLHPEEMGSLRVNLGLEQGVITGRFTVESEAARSLLLDNLETVRAEMENAGITVGEFQVNVSGRQEEFSDNGDNHGGGVSHQPREMNVTVYDTGALLLHDGEFNVVI